MSGLCDRNLLRVCEFTLHLSEGEKNRVINSHLKIIRPHVYEIPINNFKNNLFNSH